MALSGQDILDYIAAHPGARREDIRRHTAPDASSPTVWRALKRLVERTSWRSPARAAPPATAWPALRWSAPISPTL